VQWQASHILAKNFSLESRATRKEGAGGLVGTRQGERQEEKMGGEFRGIIFVLRAGLNCIRVR